MQRQEKSLGFTLIEMLVVLAIIGALSAIAIPALIGQRHKARLIGDAQSNSRVVFMGLETRKAENGTYGAPGTYTWTAAGARPGSDPVPAFQVKGNSHMDFTVVIAAGGLTYTLTANDTQDGGNKIYSSDQTGKQTFP